MRKEQGDGAGRCCPLPSLRTVALLAVGCVTFVILYWVVKDQDTVQKCHALIGSHGVEPRVIIHNVSKYPQWDYNWDRKAFKKPADAQGVGVRTILLIRHGNYDLNTGKLTPLGHRQANMTAVRLKALNMNYKMVYHSTMVRAMETAFHVRQHLPHLGLIADDDLEEGGPLPPEPTVSYWKLPARTYFTDGPRLEAAFRKYFYRADPSQKDQTFEIIVAHANICKFFALRALQLPSDAWMRVFISHASITLLHINPDGTVTMSRFGDSGHFPPDHVTY